MPQKQYVEHGDLLTSIEENNARRGFLPFGRYYGFDEKKAGTIGTPSGFAVNVGHNASAVMHYTNNLNVDETTAVVVTRQGTVVFIPTDEEAELDVIFQSVIKYQVVYGRYTWVAALGGSTLSFGTAPQVDDIPDDPTNLTGLADDEFPIGYFILKANGVGLADITWIPYDKPNLAGKADIDLSIYAKLNETNKFLATNKWGLGSLSDVNLVSITDSYAPDPRRLELPDTGNVYTLNSVLASPWTLTRIKRDGGNVEGDWLILQILAIPTGSTIQSDIGGTDGVFYPSIANSGRLELRQLSIYYFQYLSGAWTLVGAPTYVIDAISTNVASINTLTSITQDHEQRISELETPVDTSINWQDMTPKSGTGFTTYYLQYSIDLVNNTYRVRGKLLVPAGTRPFGVGISQATSIPGVTLSGNCVIPAAAIDGANHTLVSIEIYTDGGLILNTMGVDESTSSATPVTIQFDGEVPLS